MKKVVCPALWFLLTLHLFAQPRITSFSPTNGPIGSTVIIAGSNFDPIATQNIVYFGAVKAVVSAATSTSLTVIVPPGATYQPVTVTTNNLTASSNLPFNVTFNGNIGPFSSNTFLPKNNITLGKNPFAVATGDFDNDGKSDLLIPLGNSDTVSILKNTSSGGNISFSAPLNIKTTGTDNEECAIGDLDGDGKLDFVITNGIGANSFSAFRNTSTSGNISFASKTDFPAASVPTYISIGDLNGDGKPDVALANSQSSTISTYINTSTVGTISFNPKVDLVINGPLYHFSIGDLDGDGRPDLLVVTQPGNAVVSVIRNTSTGGSLSFAASVNVATFTRSRFSSVIDFDGDGKLEIVAVNGDSVAVLKNLGSPGTLSFSSAKSFAVGSSPICIASGDLNGDGKPDMIVSNQVSGNVSALRNISTAGNISFDTHVDYNVDPNPFFIAVADLDADQKPDIVSSNSDVFTISILKNAITTGPVPSISSFTPTSGIAGTQIKIKGSNFTNITAVDFGGVAASSFTVDSSTGITAIVANGATGDVRVTNGFGIAALAGFTYNGPVINSFTPSSGLIGTIVKIKGSNFTSATVVKFGGAPASSFTVDSSTGITAMVGAGASGIVTVTSPGGTASLPGFTYNLPTITSFTPASGPVGTTVTIKGSHFDPAAANNIVYFGAVKAVVSSGTDSTLVVKVPIGATYQPISVTASNITGYSNKPFGITFPGGGNPFTSNSFIPKLDVAAGNYPHSIGSGDFDGDGKLDVLVSKGSDTVVTIFQNTSTPGTVSFAPKQNFPGTGNSHENCAIGDLDGDGKLDVAIVNGTASSTVSVFRNISTVGNISFASKINFSTGSGPYSVAIGDLNGDGRPEIIVANNGSDSISVFRNVSTPGNISFDAKTSFYPGTNPFGVAVGDVDGDGKPDLAVTAQGTSSSLSLLRNTGIGGNISFAPKVDLAVLSGPFVVSIGDLDGDGKLDLAAASSTSNAVTVVRNASTPGNISFKSRNDLATGNNPVCVSISDLDGDGKSDLVTSNRASNNLSIIKNESTTGVFSFDTHVDYPVTADPLYVAAADVDGDGRPDLIAANSASDAISIFQNIIGGHVAPSITSFTPTSGIKGTVVKIKGLNFGGATSVGFGGAPAASFTVDSTTGITAVVGEGASGDVSVTTGYGTATLPGFTFNGPLITSFTPTSGINGTAITIIGLNFSGVTAVKFGGTPASSFTVDSSTGITATLGAGSTGDVTVTTPKGTATSPGFSFGLPTITSLTPASGPIGTTVTIKGTYFDSAAPNNIVFFGATRATVLSATPTQLMVTVPVGATYQPITVTVNNRTVFSSIPFVVTFDANNDQLSRNSFSIVGNFAVGTYPDDVAISDFDGDGKPDLVSSNGVSHSISVLKNISSGRTISFANKIDYDAWPDPGLITTSDLDGDGKPDIAVVNKSKMDSDTGTVSIFRNTSANGNISFSPKADYVIGNGPTGIAIHDLDGDGKPDIVVATGNSATISILKNTTASPGAISFAPKLDIPLFYGVGATIADLDKDGKPDIIISNLGATASGVSIFKNTSQNGTLSFAPNVDFTTGNQPFYVTTGDFNNDGKLDIVASNYTIGAVSLLKNTSTPGVISLDAQPDQPIGVHPLKTAIADLDGDGKLDLAEGRGETGLVSVIKNTYAGTANFSFGDTINFATGSFDTRVSIGDFDGDGKPDIVAANSIENTVSILRNTVGEPHITSVSSTNIGDGAEITVVGGNFSETNSVSFGGTPAKSFVVNSATHIDAVVGGGASGDITVTTPRGSGTYPGFKFIPRITSGGPTTFCQNGSVTLTSSASGNNQWYKNDTAIGGAIGQALSVTSSGKYVVKTTSSGITTSSDSIIVVAVSTSAPSITLNANNDLVSSAATGNQWYLNGNLIAGATSQTYHPTQSGTYTVMDNCSSDFSSAYSFILTGIINLGNDQYIKLYPNPVKNDLYLYWQIQNTISLNIILSDQQGRQVLARQNVHSGETIDVNKFPPGIYFLKIFSKDQDVNYTTKIIKQ